MSETNTIVDMPGSNRVIREAIKKIALHGLVNSKTGGIRNAGLITGYVAKIHVEGELAGTIDVQEFVNTAVSGVDEKKVGYHEGVFLSAMQDNSKGVVMIPKLYSEVTIATDPETLQEYVSMFSHVDIVQLDSHTSVLVGVTEREEFDESDEDSPDIQDLPETGLSTKTTYLKDSIESVAKTNEKSSSVKQTAESVRAEVGVSSITVEDGTVFLGSKSNTDDAVLGVELASILEEFLGYLSSMLTNTAIGPQPPMNVGKYVALKAKIASFKSSHSGFLTKKVQVQK